MFPAVKAIESRASNGPQEKQAQGCINQLCQIRNSDCWGTASFRATSRGMEISVEVTSQKNYPTWRDCELPPAHSDRELRSLARLARVLEVAQKAVPPRHKVLPGGGTLCWIRVTPSKQHEGEKREQAHSLRGQECKRMRTSECVKVTSCVELTTTELDVLLLSCMDATQKANWLGRSLLYLTPGHRSIFS